jgi:hypothetical protein
VTPRRWAAANSTHRLAELIVGERRPDLVGPDPGVRRKVDQQVRVADLLTVRPECREDGLIEREPRLVVVVFAQVVRDDLCGQRVDVGRDLEGQLDPVLLGEPTDVLSRLFGVRAVFPVVDGVVEAPIRPALLRAQVEGAPVDPEGLGARVLVPVERRPAQVAEWADVIGSVTVRLRGVRETAARPTHHRC